ENGPGAAGRAQDLVVAGEDPVLFAPSSWQLELRRRILEEPPSRVARRARPLGPSYDTPGHPEQKVSPRLAPWCFLAQGRRAREEIARHNGLEPEQVIVGNGGDELIELCFRAFAGAGDRVAFAPPTYPLFEPLCAVHEAVAVRHPLDADWGLGAGFATDPAPL